MAGMVMVMIMVLLGRPEFAIGIGGAGTPQPPPTRQERKGEYSSSLGTGSDEASRASSATHRKRTSREAHRGASQATLFGNISVKLTKIVTLSLANTVLRRLK